MSPSGLGDRFIIEPLGPAHDRNSFDCGVAALNRYLLIQAGQDSRRNIASVYVAMDRQNKKIAGFYTLSMTGVALADYSEEIKKHLPKYPNVPAIYLGRLAVDLAYRGLGLGKVLLMDAFARGLQSEIAWFSVVVDAKDARAKSFYEQYGFTPLQDSEFHLFMMRKTIEAL